MGPDVQGPQDSQQTTGNVVSPETFNVRFVYPNCEITQGSPEKRFSCIPQLSAENLNSYSFQYSTRRLPNVISVRSDIVQDPHQLKVPLTSGVVNDVDTPLIST